MDYYYQKRVGSSSLLEKELESNVKSCFIFLFYFIITYILYYCESMADQNQKNNKETQTKTKNVKISKNTFMNFVRALEENLPCTVTHKSNIPAFLR